MYAVEFETNIADGVVKIPSSYRRLQSAKNAKVLILIEDTEHVEEFAQIGFIEQFANNPVKLGESVRFLSRDEANER